jgi:hypothetical protein
MVLRAAREIQEGETVFVGTRLPLLAYLVAKATHAPGAVALYELGEVAPEAKAFTARAARWSYGGGVRYGVSEEETFRIEVAKSVEGLQTTLAIERGF